MAAYVAVALLLTLMGLSLLSAEPINIGSRLELMIDDHLVADMSGDAKLCLHRPTERGVAIVHDEPWEGSASLFHTVLRDGDLYRMYYRGAHYVVTENELQTPHRQVVCYAESGDGIHWTKPNLGIVEFDGSSDNNIIWDGPGSHNFAPFRDANPDCRPGEEYKALGGVGGEGGLLAFKSSDGIHWSLIRDAPVITRGAFDSQNLAFWDAARGEYREYHRGFRNGRDIMTSTSQDFLTWTEPAWLEYSPGRLTELYTNQITPYYRAPHILLGFPTRYVTGRHPLTPIGERLMRVSKRLGTDYTDGGLMTSRDGLHFDVWAEAFIRPGPEAKGRWVYGDNYQNWGVVETRSETSDMPELSVYANGGYWRGNSTYLYRHTLRLDGFVSVNAPSSGGGFVTKSVVFRGRELVINFATSAAGSVAVEVQDDDGVRIQGFGLQDCTDTFGDDLERVVSWKGGSDVGDLAGKAIRLRFVLRDADLYSFRFR